MMLTSVHEFNVVHKLIGGDPNTPIVITAVINNRYSFMVTSCLQGKE